VGGDRGKGSHPARHRRRRGQDQYKEKGKESVGRAFQWNAVNGRVGGGGLVPARKVGEEEIPWERIL